MLNYRPNKIQYLEIHMKNDSTFFKKDKINSMLKENYHSTKKSPNFPLSTHNLSTASTSKIAFNIFTFSQHSHLGKLFLINLLFLLNFSCNSNFSTPPTTTTIYKINLYYIIDKKTAFLILKNPKVC